MAEQPTQQDIMEFERNRAQLMTISAQKQQLQVQSGIVQKSIDELDKTSEKKVYKAVGNILILSDVSETKKELQETKESMDLRIKTLQKQEDAALNKLNALRHKIEGTPEPAPEGDTPTVDTAKKTKK